ncbi:hypothetical protein AV656_08685 [Bhargavaea cecembensis]|uniref:Enoyl-CoA hydratase n=1 Tax=Bhargavaea cecembensis TaxID=394098 RepID=A0A165H6Z4_9BACL|nr:enoyl-CoA hydratase-related protein [Bhargavaea cecembensis]KZE38964.1 hypothetical protein AV656_08685 [Bhargavaea cecembensis]
MTVQIEQDGSILILTISNPPMNTLNADVLKELDEAITKIAEDKTVRALIITGDGERAFVAGAEISEFLGLDEETAPALLGKGSGIFRRIEQLEIPVIAAINGYALGGGLELALACDIRVAAAKAKVGLPEAKLGIVPGYGGTQRLTRIAGPGTAKELIFTGRMMDADEAQRRGIIEVISDGEVLDKAQDIAEAITKNGPLAVSAAKRAIDEGAALPLDDALRLETDICSPLFGSGDMREGATAFLEKRQPQFTGR